MLINLTVDQFTTGPNVLWKPIIPTCTNTWALCFIGSLNGFLFLLKLHSNRIMCAEVGRYDFGTISQTSSVVKYFIYYSITIMKSSQSSDFIALPKWRLSFSEVSAARIIGSARLIDPSSELHLIISMWSMVALNIDTFSNLFFMVSIEPGHKFCRKELNWKVKRPSAIAAAWSKRFGLTILWPDIVCIGT